MFENLESVNWSEVYDAQGRADQVPTHIRGLLDESASARNAALSYFWDNLFHAGTRSKASEHAIPFIFEALNHEKCQIREDVIDLLLGLAVGFGETFLPGGYDLEKEEEKYKQENWKALFINGWARASYHEVRKGAKAFLRYLRPEYDRDLRLSAAFAAANFAYTLAPAHKGVSQVLALEKDPNQLLSLILCLGMLGRYANDQPDRELLLPYLRSEKYSHTVKVAAAIALSTIFEAEAPEEASSMLIKALSESWELQSPREGFQWWNEGDLLGYAAMALCLGGEKQRDKVAAALCETLAAGESCSPMIPQTLLRILFPGEKPQEGRSGCDFDQVQKDSLNALLKTRHWNLTLIDSFFLPVGLVKDEYQTALEKLFTDIGAELPSQLASGA